MNSTRRGLTKRTPIHDNERLVHGFIHLRTVIISTNVFKLNKLIFQKHLLNQVKDLLGFNF